MQAKTTGQYRFTPNRVAGIKKTDSNKCHEHTEKLEPVFTAGGM